jgi:hypothetical protein
MGWSPNRSFNNNTPTALTDMQKRYEAETGSTMFSKPSSSRGGRFSGGKSRKDREAFKEWSKTTAGMDAGKNRFNEMMANRSQNPVLGQTQAGMSGFDKFQAMQAARDTVKSNRGYNPALEAVSNILAAQGDPWSIFSGAVEKYRNRNSGQQPGYDRFQSQMGANPLILQQLQMGQRQMGPQFNAFGFGAQPGLAAQGGQGGSMLGNMSSQGMNQLAAGQQNNPTIFKAKS